MTVIAPEPHFIPPPSSLLHPTLLEKLRLGSPSSAHIHLSTINREQSNQSISETFYGLQDSAPFPRLSPYYIHKPTDTDIHRPSSIGARMDTTTDGVRPQPAVTMASTRPPSGKSNTTVAISLKTRDGLNTPPAADRTRGVQLQAKQSLSKGKGQSVTTIHTASTQSKLLCYSGWSDSDKSNYTSILRSQPWTIPQEEDDG